MCILFIYRNPNATGSSYRLIIASNRDEFYSRPTKPAHYWENNPECLGGTDEEPTKEGGTWLAVSRKGRGGILLNLAELPSNEDNDNTTETQKKGRGFLVTNYVTSKVTAEDYLSNLYEENWRYQSYNPYTLVLLDFKTANVSFLSSSLSCTGPVLSLDESIMGFGNTAVENPYKKVIIGKDKFNNIVNDSRIVDEDQLIDKLIGFLKSKKKHLPDDVMTAIHPNAYNSLSSICISQDGLDYGTRTHTIILVDAKNHLTFIEENVNDDKTWNRHRFDVSLD